MHTVDSSTVKLRASVLRNITEIHSSAVDLSASATVNAQGISPVPTTNAKILALELVESKRFAQSLITFQHVRVPKAQLETLSDSASSFRNT